MTDAEILSILDGEFTLDIPNFTKYNPGKTANWSRLSNDWFQDPLIKKVPATARYLFIVLVSLRSTKGKHLTSFSVAFVQHLADIQGGSTKLLLARLCKYGLISLRTNERTYERTGLGGEGDKVSAIGEKRVALVDPDDEEINVMDTDPETTAKLVAMHQRRRPMES